MPKRSGPTRDGGVVPLARFPRGWSRGPQLRWGGLTRGRPRVVGSRPERSWAFAGVPRSGMLQGMLSSAAPSVTSYLASLPEERRAPISTLRQLIRKRLPAGFEECMEYGMISYVVPLARYPRTYNGQPLSLAALASQKQSMSLYLMSVYGDRETERWFAEAVRRSKRRLKMGKACIRFKALEELPLDVIGDTIARLSVDEYIAVYERARGLAPGARGNGAGRARRSSGASQPPIRKNAAKKQTIAKKVSKKSAAGQGTTKTNAAQARAAKKKPAQKQAAQKRPAGKRLSSRSS